MANEMVTWIGCHRIVEDGAVLPDLDSDMMVSLDEYTERVGEVKNSVWYDPVTKRSFGIDETYENARVPNEASFLTTQKAFLNHPRWGIPHVGNNFGPAIEPPHEFVADSEVFYENKEGFGKFVDSHILVVGAGPSTNDVDWENYECDYVWSCNHFFLHPKLKDRDLALIMMNNEVSPKSTSFKKHAEQFQPMCLLETSVSRDLSDLMEYKKQGHSTSLFNLRMFTTAGTIPKLVVLAVLLGAKKVSFIGMDGHTIEDFEKQVSASIFQEGKSFVGKLSSNFNYDLQKAEYVVLWDYLLNKIGQHVEFQNLGESYSYNLSADISKQCFPLKSRI